MELTSFKTTSGNINVMERIGIDYKEFGIQLRDDSTCSITDAIERECYRKAAEINMKIFSKWLNGRGKKPVTWATLIEVLRVIQHSELAREIEQNL